MSNTGVILAAPAKGSVCVEIGAMFHDLFALNCVTYAATSVLHNTVPGKESFQKQ